jgi:hypothetical protein
MPGFEQTGQAMTVWTIRLALLCYVAYVGGSLVTVSCRCATWSALARWVWTAGCGLFVLHVAAAFQFHHHWSHWAAWESTAAETDAMLGVRFGDGIYFSYVFLVLWMVDVAVMWWQTGREPRPPVAAMWLRGLVHAYLFFIAFNGAIVFESGPSRWGGIAACILLTVLAGRAAYNWAAERGTRSAGCGAMQTSDV